MVRDCQRCLADCTWALPVMDHQRGHAAEGEGMHDTREGEASLSREPGGEETAPMWTYTFCVLQTFHRLCKTSESVTPLKMWEERGRGRGTGKLTGQFSRGSSGFTFHLLRDAYNPSANCGLWWWFGLTESDDGSDMT